MTIFMSYSVVSHIVMSKTHCICGRGLHLQHAGQDSVEEWELEQGL